MDGKKRRSTKTIGGLMTLKELYAVYGELHIQVEIMQGKMMEIKQKIAKGLND